MEYTLIELSPDCPFTLLTEISLRCNDVVTRRYREYEKQGLDWLGRMVITKELVDLADAEDIRMILEDQIPKIKKYRLADRRLNAVYDVTIRCRRMGEDNGKDQLVNITNYLRQIRDYARKTTRKPTPEELARMMELVSRL